eukprot:5189648-Amphidinium_carterae.1
MACSTSLRSAQIAKHKAEVMRGERIGNDKSHLSIYRNAIFSIEQSTCSTNAVTKRGKQKCKVRQQIRGYSMLPTVSDVVGILDHHADHAFYELRSPSTTQPHELSLQKPTFAPVHRH